MLSNLLSNFIGARAPLPARLQASDVLYRLAEIEADAVEYYEMLAKHASSETMRNFANQLIVMEKAHQVHFQELARQAEESAGGNRLKASLPEELIDLLSTRITLSPKGVEKTMPYLGDNDAVQLAIYSETKTIELLSGLKQYVPVEQHAYIDTVLREEHHHKASLETLFRNGCGDSLSE